MFNSVVSKKKLTIDRLAVSNMDIYDIICYLQEVKFT